MYSVFLCSLGVTIYIYIISRNCFTAWVSGFTHFCFKGTDLTENYIKIFLKTQFNIFVFSLVLIKSSVILWGAIQYLLPGQDWYSYFFFSFKSLGPKRYRTKTSFKFYEKVNDNFCFKKLPIPSNQCQILYTVR